MIELKDDQVQQEDRKKLFSKLTGLMGKDIVSLLSLPVSLFEPTSVLQTMVEPLRHSELLFQGMHILPTPTPTPPHSLKEYTDKHD